MSTETITTQNKALMIDLINSLDDEKVNQLYSLFSGLVSYDLRAISKSLNVDLDKVDFAKPQDWCDTVRRHGVSSIGYVWSYQEQRAFGAPLNLHSLLLQKIMELCSKSV